MVTFISCIAVLPHPDYAVTLEFIYLFIIIKEKLFNLAFSIICLALARLSAACRREVKGALLASIDTCYMVELRTLNKSNFYNYLVPLMFNTKQI